MNEATFPLRPPNRRWLIETEIVGTAAPGWTRLAVLAPTSKAAAQRGGAALGWGVNVLRSRRDHEADLDEEAALLSRLDDHTPVVWSRPVWAAAHHAALPAELKVSVTGPGDPQVRGLDALPAELRAAGETDRIYAVLDGAAIFGLPELLDGSGLDWRCLFQGAAARDYAGVAPYLIELAPGNPLMRKLLRPPASVPAPGAATAIESGIFLSGPVSLDGIWRHLRKFTMLADATRGNRVFFRFYDPLIFRTLVVNMAANDLATFCTGIRAMAAVNAGGGFTMINRRTEGR